MITLQELFDDLAYGELTAMAVGNGATGIAAKDYPKIVSFINMGLTDLYTRFSLRENKLIMYQREGIERYPVRSDYLGDPTDSSIYFDGTGNEVTAPAGDIIEFIEAYDEDNNTIRINDAKYPEDIFLPEPDIIQITPRNPLIKIFLRYRATYPKIVVGSTFIPTDVLLYFPLYIKKALLTFVAARFYTGKTSKTTEGETRLTNTFWYMYKNEIQTLMDNGNIPAGREEPLQFEIGGWV